LAEVQSRPKGVLAPGLVTSSMKRPLPPQPSVITSTVFQMALSLVQLEVQMLLTLGELARP
jgi:hypothetical protein